MKKVISVLALLAVSGLGMAQTSDTQKQSTPPAQNQSTTPGQNQAPQQGIQMQGTPGAQTPAPAPAAPTGKRQPQAKTQEEFAAYNEVAQKPDPASMEQAANAFAQKYPESELRSAAYQNLMLQYQNANNSDKTIEIGRKTLQVDPDNAVALVTVASTLSVRTRESDLDKEERLSEAKKDATHAIELMDSGNGVPANLPADKVQMYKNTILANAYSALGQSEFVNNNFPVAEQNLRKSVSFTDITPDPITWFQLSLALDRQGKYQDAQQAAQKCIDVAQGHPVAQYCTQERDHAKQAAANPPAKPATTPK